MRAYRVDGPFDLRGTLAPLVARRSDPTLRVGERDVLRATRTPDGPASLHAVQTAPDRIEARAWGPGAAWALERLPDYLGLRDVRFELPDGPPRLRELARRARGVRLARTHRILELLVPLVLQQQVSGKEAARAFRNLVRGFSEPAPGPVSDLWLPLDAATLRELPGAALPPLGVPERRGATLRELGFRAARVEEADVLPPGLAEGRLRAFPGIGVWSARSALLNGMGDPDAVPLGDWNLPSWVAWNLVGEERADDARMLELLAPHAGRRGRVLRWILAGGSAPPRRAPRAALRPLPRA